jgi:hypothetical protein
MNAAAAQALYDAERGGIRQIRGQFADGDGGFCAIGVLAERSLEWGLELWRLSRQTCPLCGLTRSNKNLMLCEADVIIHLNDDHELSFAEIARKLGPDSV